jgi:hypothetical protein
MLDAAELADIQADAVAATCDQVCVVQRAGSRTPEPEGGGTTTPTTVETTVAGLSQPTAGMLQNYGYLVGSLSAWQVKLPVVSVAQEKDTLLIGGQKLQVVKRLSPRSYAALLTCLCVEVK